MSIKRLIYRYFLLLCMTGILTSSLQGQDAGEIADRVVAAMGGAPELRKLETMVKSGYLLLGKDSAGILVTQVNQKAKRTDYKVHGMSGFDILTTHGGWTFLPFAGQSDVRTKDSAELHSRACELDLPGILVDYGSKGYTATLQKNELYEKPGLWRVLQK
jgi:hypothetical protein